MSVQLTGESMQKKESNFEFGFFKLENNHDKAIVRLLHENYEDFSRRPVHYVRVPDKKYRVGVNCLRADNMPDSECPFCSSQISTDIVSKRRKRMFVEFLVYKILDRNNKVLQDYTEKPRRMVWERDRSFDDKIFSLSSRFNPLCDTVFQVERFGEKQSTDTSYDIYQIDVDKSQYPYELPEKVYNPDGIQILDKTFDEMNYYLENNSFPPVDNTNKGSEEGVTRRSDVATAEAQPVQPAYTQPVQPQVQPAVQPEPQYSQPVNPAPVQPQVAAQPQPTTNIPTRRRSI